MNQREHRARHRTATDEWQDTFQGTGVIYVLEPDAPASSTYTAAPDVIIADYDIDALGTTWPEQQRAAREERTAKGLSVPALPGESLRDKLLVVLGPELSAASAIAALEHLITGIRRDGLLTGENSAGTMVSEPVEEAGSSELSQTR